MRKEVLRADNITWESDGVRYLDMFNLHIFAGEIMGLFFVDHHGKEEFIDVITENAPIDYGDLFFHDELVNTYLFSHPRHNAGVALISPVNTLVDGMTVADNVFVLRRNFRKYVIDTSVLQDQFRLLAEEYGIEVAGGTRAGDLSMTDRYLIQLLKAVITGHSLIVVHNIADTVEPRKLQKIHGFIRRLADRGLTFLCIENQYRDMFALCDRLALVEKGRVLHVPERRHFHDDYFRQYFFDPKPYAKVSEEKSDDILRFRNLSFGNLNRVSFTISAGESLLFWDQSDRVLRDMVDLMTATVLPEQGDILFEGRPLSLKRKPLPIGLIEETPDRSMVFHDMSYLDNLCFLAGERNPNIWTRPALKRNIRTEYYPLIGDDIDAPGLADISREALYKLVYYRNHIYCPRLLVLVQPFRETDRKLKIHILSIISALRERGTAFLILDASMAESAAIADRTLVFRRGKFVNEIVSSEADGKQGGRN